MEEPVTSWNTYSTYIEVIDAETQAEQVLFQSADIKPSRTVMACGYAFRLYCTRFTPTLLLGQWSCRQSHNA